MVTTRRPSNPATGLALAVALLAGWAGLIDDHSAQAQDSPGRQVVMFGVLATPGSTDMDPKIPSAVAAKLRKLLPGHGFRLVKVKNGRVVSGQSLGLDLGGGFTTKAQLVTPLDPNGKVQLKFDLSLDGASQFQSMVTTPADQFNFFDKMLPDDSHLVIGVGAR